LSCVDRVYTFVDASLGYNPCDTSSLNCLTETTDANNNKHIPVTAFGYNASLTTFELNQGVERIYSLGSRVPQVLVPLRFEGRFTATFSLTGDVGILNNLVDVSPSGDIKLVNIYVRPGRYGPQNEVFLVGGAIGDFEVRAREGEIVEVSVNGVFKDVLPGTGGATIDYTGPSGSVVTFADATITINGNHYPVREYSLRVDTGYKPAYSLGDRRYTIVYQDRQEVTLRATIYGTESSLRDLVENAGVGLGGVDDPVDIGATLNFGGNGSISLSGGKISRLGTPVRIGEIVMLDVEYMPLTISIAGASGTSSG